MMKFKDMDQAEAWSGQGLLPPGVHDVTITEVEESESSKGNPQWVIQFDADSGMGIKEWAVVIPSTYGKIRSLLDACKIEPQSGDWEFDPQTLKGKKLSIRVGTEEYQGQSRARVQGYFFHGQGSTDVAGDTSGLPANGGPAKRDDDIPF